MATKNKSWLDRLRATVSSYASFVGITPERLNKTVSSIRSFVGIKQDTTKGSLPNGKGSNVEQQMGAPPQIGAPPQSPAAKAPETTEPTKNLVEPVILTPQQYTTKLLQARVARERSGAPPASPYAAAPQAPASTASVPFMQASPREVAMEAIAAAEKAVNAERAKFNAKGADNRMAGTNTEERKAIIQAFDTKKELLADAKKELKSFDNSGGKGNSTALLEKATKLNAAFAAPPIKPETAPKADDEQKSSPKMR